MGSPPPPSSASVTFTSSLPGFPSGEASGIVHLSVGGTQFTTTRATLCAEKGSLLARKFSRENPLTSILTGERVSIFIDRNPGTFQYILDYLRNGCRLLHKPPDHLLSGVLADAEYFRLDGLAQACRQLIASRNRPKRYESRLESFSIFDDFFGDQTRRWLEACDKDGWETKHMTATCSGEAVFLQVREIFDDASNGSK